MKVGNYFMILGFLLTSCSGSSSHLESFYRFIDAVAYSDMDMLKNVSTETTVAIIEHYVYYRGDSSHSQMLVDIVKSVNRSNNVQYCIEIVGDTVSSDTDTAIVEFCVKGSDSRYAVAMVRKEGKWLVDMEILD